MNGYGPRVDYGKVGGSLTKWPGRRGTGGFQPLDRDLTIRTNPDLDLIPCVGYGSCGSEPTPTTAAASSAGKPFPTAALHANSPELADSCVPGAKSAGVRVGRTPCITRDPLGKLSGFGGDRGGVRSGGGGPARRSSSACQSSGAGAALRATLIGQKGRAGGGGPHRGSNQAGASCRSRGDES